MPIKPFLTAEEFEQADESTKALYSTDPRDGRHMVDLEDREGVGLADVNKLTSAAQAARQERDEATRKANEAVQKVERLTAQLDQLGGDDADEIIRKRVEEQVTEAKQQAQDAIRAAQEEKQTFLDKQVASEADRQILDAIGRRDDIKPAGREFLADLLRKESKKRRTDEGGVIVTLIDPEYQGQDRMSREDASRPMNLDERLDELSKDAKYGMFYDVSGPSGSDRNDPPPNPSQRSGGGSGGDFLDLPPAQRLAAARQRDGNRRRRTSV